MPQFGTQSEHNFHTAAAGGAVPGKATNRRLQNNRCQSASPQARCSGSRGLTCLDLLCLRAAPLGPELVPGTRQEQGGEHPRWRDPRALVAPVLTGLSVWAHPHRGRAWPAGDLWGAASPTSRPASSLHVAAPRLPSIRGAALLGSSSRPAAPPAPPPACRGSHLGASLPLPPRPTT